MQLGIGDEFWLLTPYEMRVLVKEWKDKTNLAHSTAAYLCALFANANRSPGSLPFSPEEFLPFPASRRFLTVDEADALSERFPLVESDG